MKIIPTAIICSLITLITFMFIQIMVVNFVVIDEPGKCDYAIIHFHDIGNNKVFEHLHPIYETYFCTWIMTNKDWK